MCLSLTACATRSVGSRVPDSVPDALVGACLALPLATDPTKNGELLDAFVVSREGHEVCRSAAQVVQDNYVTQE